MASEITSDMIKVTTQKCKQCFYSAYYSGSTMGSCSYLLITGERRKCPVGYCDKFKTRETKGRRFNHYKY